MSDIYIPEHIRELVKNHPFHLDDIGHSGSQVLMFEDKVLKIQPRTSGLDAEQIMMNWLENKLPVPKCLYHTIKNDADYLLMTRINGKMACDEEFMSDVRMLVKILADGIKQMWQVNISDCPINQNLNNKLECAKDRIESKTVNINEWEPSIVGSYRFETPMQLYDWLIKNQPTEELVFSHGDYCLPNVFIDNNKLSGFIDLGHAGIADKWQDIALCYRSLKHNFNGKFSNRIIDDFDHCILFEALGIEPDWEKINYYILLDELF